MNKKDLELVIKQLNNIETLEDVNKLKEEYTKELNELNAKPTAIVVEWVGCYELTKDGTKENYYEDIFQFLEDTEWIDGLDDWDELRKLKSNEDYETVQRLINENCGTNFSLKDIMQNRVISLVEKYWEGRETMDLEVYYEKK